MFEVLLVQVVPLSEDVRRTPELPDATNVPFPKVMSWSNTVEFEVLPVQVIPSGEVETPPDCPTITNILFP